MNPNKEILLNPNTKVSFRKGTRGKIVLLRQRLRIRSIRSSERSEECVSDLVTERIIASTCNQPVEIVFIFEFLISNKLYTATLIITTIPP